MTLEKERPFSFYYRDKNKKPQPEPELEWANYKFKANPIRWTCSLAERKSIAE